MKAKIYAALVTCVALAGLLAATPRAAVAESDCNGGGVVCAVTRDGTTYYHNCPVTVEQ